MQISLTRQTAARPKQTDPVRPRGQTDTYRQADPQRQTQRDRQAHIDRQTHRDRPRGTDRLMKNFIL